MRRVLALVLLVGCSKHAAAPPTSQEARPLAAVVPASNVTSMAPAGARRSFAVGDKVIMIPSKVMVISAIGPRRQLTPAGMANFEFQPGNALAGEDTMRALEADDVQVYGLRFPSHDHDSFLLEVARADEEHLRHLSTPEQIDAFLSQLHAAAQAARAQGFRKPDNVLRATLAAHNDLTQLARLYPLLDPTAQVEADVHRSLEGFFVDEISTVMGISTDDARARLHAALR